MGPQEVGPRVGLVRWVRGQVSTVGPRVGLVRWVPGYVGTSALTKGHAAQPVSEAGPLGWRCVGERRGGGEPC